MSGYAALPLVFAFILSLTLTGCASYLLVEGRIFQHKQLGTAALEAGKFEECIAETTTAINMTSPYLKAQPIQAPYSIAQSRYLRGRCYQGLGKHGKALADFEEALAIKNTDCHHPGGGWGGGDPCKQAADIMEFVAMSKKALVDSK